MELVSFVTFKFGKGKIMDDVTLYTTHCPKCEILRQKLFQKNIKYDIVEDIDLIQSLGFSSVPILKVNEDFLVFPRAVKWINEQQRSIS